MFPSRRKVESEPRSLCLPHPACGERVGVRGVLAIVEHPSGLPLTREPRCARLPTPPRQRGEVIGCAGNPITGALAAAITYADFGAQPQALAASTATLPPAGGNF